jgi:hypothetical protein
LWRCCLLLCACEFIDKAMGVRIEKVRSCFVCMCTCCLLPCAFGFRD